MKMKRLKHLMMILALLLLLYPSLQVQAKVQNFPGMYMDITLPENTVVLTKNTPNSDPLWQQAKITDPKKEKESFTSMGAQAIFYDPDTSTTVRLLQKQSKDSKEVFNLSLLSESELKTFLDGLFKSEDSNTTYTIEKYPQQEVPFFRLNLNVVKEGVTYSEVIYGTIMNGYTISYDIYQSNSSKAIDESYIQKLVADTHFTLVMDKAEAARQERLATITMAVISAVLIVLFILWRILRKKSLRKKLEAKKQRTDALTQFFIRQRQKEEDNIRDTPLMTNHTTFSEAVIRTFYMYDRLIHHIKLWIISGALILIFLATLYSSGSLLVMLITILLVIVFVYIQGFQIDKAINRAMKVYEKNKNMNAVYTFYEDYFTLSGIQSNSVYPYIQITEVKAYKEYIYIYLGEDKAHYLQKSGFEPGLEQFLELMKRCGKLK